VQCIEILHTGFTTPNASNNLIVMKKRLTFPAAMLAALMAVSSTISATAEIVSFQITATVNSIDDSGNFINGAINVGDVVTGVYTINTATPDDSPLETVGSYQHTTSPFGISLSVNGYSFRTNPDDVDFLVIITDNHLGEDSYTARSYENQFDISVPNQSLSEIVWLLLDESENALASTALTAAAPNLSDWPVNQLQISSKGEGDDFTISCTVTSVVVVPNVTLELEHSTNLVDWESVVITPEMIVDGKLQFPSPEPAAFFRMKMP